MAIYLHYDGIDGEATQDDHKKWIDIGSLTFGVGRGIASPVGSAGNRGASQPSVSEITITKLMDGASPKLFTESVTGEKGKVVKIHLVTTGNPGVTYTEYTLTDTLISGYSISSGGERPQESISLNFTKIEYKFTPLEKDNKAGTPVTVSYDLATAKSG
jgi:type VI secretion system secreted protein Hcp